VRIIYKVLLKAKNTANYFMNRFLIKPTLEHLFANASIITMMKKTLESLTLRVMKVFAGYLNEANLIVYTIRELK